VLLAKATKSPVRGGAFVVHSGTEGGDLYAIQRAIQPRDSGANKGLARRAVLLPYEVGQQSSRGTRIPRPNLPQFYLIAKLSLHFSLQTPSQIGLPGTSCC